MALDFKIYRSLLPLETKITSDLLSLGFYIPAEDMSFKVLNDLNPVTLLSILKQHRLYPAFYRLNLPYQQLDDTAWLKFASQLKQLAQANNLQMLNKTAVLVKVVNAFDKNGILVLSLKGPILSKLLYNDLGLKASIDLDILISENHWDLAVNTLYSLGFIQTKFTGSLNKHQKKYLLNHFHHIGFYNAKENVQLELHWQLNTNKYLLHYNFEELYNQATNVEVGNQSIKTLDPCSLIIHLMVHGSHHAWARLDWLYEYGIALAKYKDYDKDISRECKHSGLDKLFHQSNLLSNIIFRTEHPFREDKYHSFIKFCINAISQAKTPDVSKPVQRLKYKIYLTKLKKGFRYKTHVWLAMRTNVPDWQTINLPDKLFFLYYFLRPILVLIKVFSKRRSK